MLKVLLFAALLVGSLASTAATPLAQSVDACHMTHRYLAGNYDLRCEGTCPPTYPNCRMSFVTSGGFLTATCDCWNVAGGQSPEGVTCYATVVYDEHTYQIQSVTCTDINCSGSCTRDFADESWSNVCNCE